MIAKSGDRFKATARAARRRRRGARRRREGSPSRRAETDRGRREQAEDCPSPKMREGRVPQASDARGRRRGAFAALGKAPPPGSAPLLRRYAAFAFAGPALEMSSRST
jgi:hypothetical protein